MYTYVYDALYIIVLWFKHKQTHFTRFCREDERSNVRRREILQAALSFVPQHGWTHQSLALGSCNLL